jgi:hypothetical protein
VIPVKPAAPPDDFEARVRTPGLNAIAELAGETPNLKRRGPKRKETYKSRDTIPAEKFPPLWREVLPDMLDRYSRVCAYLSLYIEHATGTPSVDHVVPKSQKWDQVYEWSNYRLACLLVNAKKNDLALLHDPFSIREGLFALELVMFEVIPGENATLEEKAQVETTVNILGLNAYECCKAREAYVLDYEKGPLNDGISLRRLEKRAPFIAKELRRQGKLLRGDV